MTAGEEPQEKQTKKQKKIFKGKKKTHRTTNKANVEIEAQS